MHIHRGLYFPYIYICKYKCASGNVVGGIRSGLGWGRGPGSSQGFRGLRQLVTLPCYRVHRGPIGR